MGKKKKCLRCGKCCFVNMIAYAREEDYNRWRRESRDDIIKIIESKRYLWAGDRIVSSESGDFSHLCPFLQNDGTLFSCTIYDTRPRICRDYIPGSSEICPRWSNQKRKE
ncbi:MAG: YkgJ family cysteine cluster protein [Syntrophales bacterium]|nr:YkgJ family cysteine cluster protein [Syntrophales bacterium]